MTNTLTQCRCLRCQYAWYQRGPSIPIMCPACKSRYWNQAREETREEAQP